MDRKNSFFTIDSSEVSFKSVIPSFRRSKSISYRKSKKLNQGKLKNKLIGSIELLKKNVIEYQSSYNAMLSEYEKFKMKVDYLNLLAKFNKIGSGLFEWDKVNKRWVEKQDIRGMGF